MTAVGAPARATVRTRVRVEGTVQGVGFRPHVYRLAGELGLAGFVLNDAHGVLVEVEGAPPDVEAFVARVGAESPPLARVERVGVTECEATGQPGFAIRPSPRDEVPDAPVAVDAATCDDCLRELLDPLDRRYGYPFINCTNCGPRFTIVRGIPYDRPFTTMAGFTMCWACQAEYDDPGDRRFHAQPNACAQCGPRLTVLDAFGAGLHGDPVAVAAAALRDGGIVAVKGVGGFHLACRAGDEPAVARLRARKRREAKPFALMARDLAGAASLVELAPAASELLMSPARPIVLAPRRPGTSVAASVAPGMLELGVMLPYAPLQHLLLAGAGETLVMTSGNVSDEPIAYRDEDAIERLGGIADLFLVHDRPIETRTDDSVVRAIEVGGRSSVTFLRRSRGYVPDSLSLPGATPVPLLAVGAELKSTFCLAKGERAWMSHHIGDLKNPQTLESLTEGVAHFERLFCVDPRAVAHDLHPDYLSTRYALERDDDLPVIGVQHHHAHLAACLAEYGCGPGIKAVGAIFDGAGYGGDGTVWGGELLVGDVAGFTRAGSLYPVPLPGGDRAARQPWRMACAWLGAADGVIEPALPPALSGVVDRAVWRQVAGVGRSGINSPLTTSVGRLFDAVAALCGFGAEVSYEGQAAIALEAACDPHERGRYPLEVLPGAGRLPPGEGLCLDARATVAAAAADVASGVAVGVVASRFHAAVAEATVEACARAAGAHGTEIAVLSGGVFQNRRLLQAVGDGLARRGLRVLVPERLPAGDGGVAFGQAAVAAARLIEAAG